MPLTLGTKTFRLGRRFDIEVADDNVTPEGVTQIYVLWQAALGSTCFPDASEIGGWAWTVEEGSIKGKLPKRLSKWAHEHRKAGCTSVPEKLPTTLLEQIGNLARTHANQPTVKTIDFTRKFNWLDGDFGDGGSCFWGGRGEARRLLKDHGALAMRFWQQDGDRWRGYGRCWIVPDAPEPGMAIVFNGYMRGTHDNWQTVGMAKFLATTCALGYRKIDLSNCDDDTGVVYINGGTGYVVGERTAIAALPDWYDLRWPESRHTHRCLHCDLPLESSARLELTGERPSRWPYVCRRCRLAHYSVCATCQTAQPTAVQPLVVLVGGLDGNHEYAVCANCDQQHGIECADCNRRVYRVHTRTIGGRRVCYACANNYPRCVRCSEFFGERGQGAEASALCRVCTEREAERARVQNIVFALRREGGWIPMFVTLAELQDFMGRHLWSRALAGDLTRAEINTVEAAYGEPFEAIFPRAHAAFLRNQPREADQRSFADLDLPEVREAFVSLQGNSPLEWELIGFRITIGNLARPVDVQYRVPPELVQDAEFLRLLEQLTAGAVQARVEQGRNPMLPESSRHALVMQAFRQSRALERARPEPLGFYSANATTVNFPMFDLSLPPEEFTDDDA